MPSDAAVADVDFILKSLHEATQHMPPGYRIGNRAVAATDCSRILIREAHRLREQGQPSESLLRLVQAVELSRFQQSEATNSFIWMSAVGQERMALERLRRFSADDSLTEENLQAAFLDLQQICSAEPSLVDVAENQYIVCRQLMKHEGYLWNRRAYALNERGWPESHKFFNKDLLTLSSAQRERSLRWAALIVDSASGITSEWLDGNLHKLDAIDSDVIHYVDTAMLDSWPRTRGWLRALSDDEKATAITIGLQQYCRKHMRFPEQLTFLRDIGIGWDHAWLGKSLRMNTFSYAPHGLGDSVPFYDNSPHVVPLRQEMGMGFDLASRGGGFGGPLGSPRRTGRIVDLSPEQPLLWSSGPMGPSELRDQVAEYRQQTSADPLSAHPLAPNEIYFACGTRGFDPMETPDSLKRALGSAASEYGFWP